MGVDNLIAKLKTELMYHQYKVEEFGRVLKFLEEFGKMDRHVNAVRKMNKVAKKVGLSSRGVRSGKMHKNDGVSIKDYLRQTARGLKEPFTFKELCDAALPNFKTSSKNPLNVLGVEFRKLHKEFRRAGRPGDYRYSHRVGREAQP